MPNRAQRRTTARKETPKPAAAQQPPLPVPEPGAPFPSFAALSRRIVTATVDAKPSASSHEIPIPGTRPNGEFQVLPTEDALGFEAFKQALLDEHQPSTITESILVNTMAESHWLGQRAQRLQYSCFDLATGQIADAKMFALYLRCESTHTRAFHKSLTDLLKLRSERRKEELGFEAQKIKSEQHEMKKQKHYWEVLRRDAEASHQIAQNTLHNLKAAEECPGFEAQFAAELASRGLERGALQVAVPAAA